MRSSPCVAVARGAQPRTVAVVRATTNKQHPYTPRSSSLSRSLQAAQDAAKAGKRGGWGLGEAGLPFFGDGPAAPTAAEAAAAAGGGPKVAAEKLAVVIADIAGGGKFYVHDVAKRDALKALDEKMAAFSAKVGVGKGAPVELRRGLLLAALFDAGEGLAWCE